MTALADHTSSKYVKFLYIGDSGTGKTGSLTSLVEAGYKLRILDTDYGTEVLAQYVRKFCPDKIGNVDYETVRDKYRPTASGMIIAGMPKAYIDGLKLMEKWSDGSVPAEWGSDTIFVLDSLSTFALSAFEWAKGLNPTAREPRTWYFVAQQSLETMLSSLTSEDFKCNVIVISHVNFRERLDGMIKGYPNSIGSALGPIIGRYFNTFLLAETVGAGKNATRKIKTVTTGTIDLKNPAPFKIDATLPLETGLATAFAALKDTTTGKDNVVSSK